MSLIKRTGNIYEQQHRNARLTNFLVACFLVYFFVLGYGTDLFLFKTDALGLFHPDEAGVPWATLVSVVLAGVYAAYSYFRGDEMVLHSVNLDRVWGDIGEGELLERIWVQDHPNDPLVHVVQEMSIAGGVPVPAIYTIHDHDANAFATGRDPDHASIAVTEGLLRDLTREELEAVVAHEISHIRNYDTRLMMMIAALTSGSLLLAGVALVREISMVSKLRLAGGIALFFVVWLGMAILTPLFTRIVSMAISREREYQADVEATVLTRDPVSLLHALEKIEGDMGQTRSISIAISHLCITDPMGKYFQVGEEGFFRRWFPTHPPVAKRIAALKEMGHILGPESDRDSQSKEGSI